MRNRFWIPAAVTLALAAGSAHAQVFPNGAINNYTPGFFSYSRSGGFNPINGIGFGGNSWSQFRSPGFAAGAFGAQSPGFFQFNPAQGFSLRSDFVPSIGAGTTNPNATPTTVSPGASIQGGLGYGGGYYGNYYGGGYYPGGYYGNYYNTGDYPADYYGNGAPAVNPEAAGGVVPGDAQNVVPPANVPNASARTPEERRAALAAARRERQEDAAIQRQYQALARTGSLASGTLVSLRNGTARVRYKAEGTRKIGRFSANEVYFFTTKRADEGAQVATLDSAPGIKLSGDQVMVALPVASRPITVSQRGSSIVISNR
jgi:hypothetical protein